MKLTPKRASYRVAVRWIAANDNPGDSEGPDQLKSYVSVLLAADLFDVEPIKVAVDVWEERMDPKERREFRRSLGYDFRYYRTADSLAEESEKWKPGMRFVHAQFMDGERAPLVCKITRVALGVVYYRPDYGQHSDGSEWLGAPYYCSRSEMERHCAPVSWVAAWYEAQQPDAQQAKAESTSIRFGGTVDDRP